jgi:signal transduction histidine kinase
MMKSSLRSRLLFTYAIIIGTVICVISIALIIYILQNPAIDRQVYSRLEQTADLVIRQRIVYSLHQDYLVNTINRIDSQGNVRVLILTSEKDILLDSRSDSPSLSKLGIDNKKLIQRGIVLDSENNPWLVIWRSLEEGGYLVLATPRIRRIALLFTERLRDVLKDDLLPVLIQGASVAFILAFLISIWISNWIAAPLNQIAEATQEIQNGNQVQIITRGPKEVQYLTAAFNDMASKVIASQKSQRDFIANVSHELKTPLTSIQGYAQAILDGTVENNGSVIQAANIIHTEADRMNRLVLELLDLAKLEARTTKMKSDPVDINLIIEQVVDRFTPQAILLDILIEYNQINLPLITGDEERLIQAFSNLVDNAIKNTPRNGKIYFEAIHEEAHVVVKVVDTGIGIKLEEQSRIFERFYQVEKSRSGPIGRGSGLGLPISAEIVRAHGGAITVESISTQGSVFVVKLPITPPNYD